MKYHTYIFAAPSQATVGVFDVGVVWKYMYLFDRLDCQLRSCLRFAVIY